MNFLPPRLWLGLRFLDPCKAFSRKLLANSYGCKETWNNRLNSPAFRTHSASDLGAQILHRLSNNTSVSPLDYDIFINKLQQTEKLFLDFAEKIILKFQKTQNALHVLPSTSHAVVQAYLHFDENSRLLNLLQRRSETGIFLDEVSANLLLTRFIETKDYTSALSVLWELCLQSHLVVNSLQPYLLALWLHTISLSLKSGEYFRKEEKAITEDVDDDEEIDYQRVPYLRNPNFDNWFDISRSRLKLGHCILSLANAIERYFSTSSPSSSAIERTFVSSESSSSSASSDFPSKSTSAQTEGDPPPFSPDFQSLDALSANALATLKLFSQTLRFLAFSLLEDFTELSALFRTASAKPEILPFCDEEVLDAIGKLIECSESRPDNSDVKCGEPLLNTESEVNHALDEFKIFTKIFQPSDLSLFSKIDAVVVELVSNDTILANEQNRVHNLYAEYTSIREKVWCDNLAKIKRKEVLADVKTRLRNLVDEEERLTYFDNASVIEEKAWLAPRTKAERRWSRFKEWKKELREYNEKKNISRRSLSES